MIYSTGCVGKISSFEETPDGRNLISLDGLVRFNVVEELEMKDGYRRVNVSYTVTNMTLMLSHQMLTVTGCSKHLENILTKKVSLLTGM